MATRAQLKQAVYRAQGSRCYECGEPVPSEVLFLHRDGRAWFLLCPPCKMDAQIEDGIEGAIERMLYG